VRERGAPNPNNVRCLALAMKSAGSAYLFRFSVAQLHNFIQDWLAKLLAPVLPSNMIKRQQHSAR